MGDSVLILGAGLMQRPAILSAKELGLETFVIDANPAAPCVNDADHFEQIDLKNREKIASYAQRLKEEAGLKTVFTAGTDFSANVAYANQACGFGGHSFEACVNASDKALMRQCFRNARVPNPHFILIEKRYLNNVLTDQVVESLKFPYVVKPVDNMGARGCRMVRSRDELFEAVNNALNFSRSGRALLEEYMEGPEFSIDALVYDGSITVTGFADRHIFFEPYFIETGHTMPTQLPYKQFISLIKTFAAGIKSLGLSCGAAKADIKWTKNGPMVGEIAARLSGGYMSGWTFPYASDLNLTREALLVSLGRRPEALEENRFPLDSKDCPFRLFNYGPEKVSAERAWISIPGKVEKVLFLSDAEKTPFVKNVFPRVQAGDTVTFPRNNVEKCGNVISQAPTRKEAVSSCEDAVSKILILLERDNPETDAFLKKRMFLNDTSFDSGFPPDAFCLPIEIARNFSFELDCDANKKIPEFEPVENFIPLSLMNCLDIKDWNHLSLLDSIKKFDKMNLNHTEINYKKFWHAMIRGGIQGALYVSR